MNRDKTEQESSPWDPQDKTASVLPSFTQFCGTFCSRPALLTPNLQKSRKIVKMSLKCYPASGHYCCSNLC